MKLSASYPWRFAGIVLTCAAILVARSPDLVVTPRLAVEDGSEFFAGAFNHPLLEAILTPYAGYWHLAPRLVAAAGTLLPVAVVPQFYACCALLVSSLALSWFYLPHFRTVVAHDSLRLAFVLLLVLLPGLDGPLLLAYIQWPLALWGMLLVLMTPPPRLWVQWLLAAVYLIALATAPALFVLLPLWLWRFVKAPSTAERGWIGLILFGTVAMIVATLQLQRGSPIPPVNWSLLATDVTRGIAFRYFVSPFTGFTLGNEIARTMGWPVIYILASVVAGILLLFMALPLGGRNKRGIYVALAYIIASSALLYIRRSPAYHYPFAVEGATILALRYYFLGICGVLLLCLALVDGLVTQQSLALTTAWIGIFILVLLYSPDFALWRWWNPNWPHTAHLLNHIVDPNAQDAVTWSPQYSRPASSSEPVAGASVVPLRIPISPEGWVMVLELGPNQPQGYVFPEGPRLLSMDSQVHGDQLEVDLDWQTEAATELDTGQNYTAYVHLLDKDGERIEGADVTLEPSSDMRKPDEVWTTHHLIALPKGLSAGSYDVAIGLYTFEEGDLKPGSAVIIRNQVHLGQPNSY